jgi:hypothetical protein
MFSSAHSYSLQRWPRFLARLRTRRKASRAIFMPVVSQRTRFCPTAYATHCWKFHWFVSRTFCLSAARGQQLIPREWRRRFSTTEHKHQHTHKRNRAALQQFAWETVGVCVRVWVCRRRRSDLYTPAPPFSLARSFTMRVCVVETCAAVAAEAEAFISLTPPSSAVAAPNLHMLGRLVKISNLAG